MALLYTAKHRKYEQNGHITPGVMVSEGRNPSLPAMVAPYLPLVRYNKHDDDWIVVSQGKLIALDSYGYIVPAGLAIEIAAEVATPNSSVLVYTQTDEDEGVIGPDGELVSAGDKVAAKLVASQISVSRPFAVAATTYYRSSSDEYLALNEKRVAGGGALPIEWRHHNYNVQQKVSVECDCLMEIPVVSTYDPPFEGVVAFDAQSGVGLPVPGAYVKLDRNSNFILWVDGVDSLVDKVGQIVNVDKRFPKGFLKYVQTVFGEGTGGGAGTEFGVLDEMPGSATDGLPDKITFAGGSAQLGTVQINLTEF